MSAISIPGRNEACSCGSGRKIKRCCINTHKAKNAAAASSVDAIFRTAAEHHEAGRLDAAMKLYAAVLERKPDHSPSLLLLGKVARQIGRLDEAICLMRQAISLNPHSPQYLLELGGTLFDAKRFSDAVTVLQKACELDPNSPQVRYSLGLALVENNQLDEAINQFMAALAIDPNNAEVFASMGAALLRKDDRKAAYASMRGALMLRPSNVETLLRLGEGLRCLGAFDDAIRCFREAMQAAPKDSRAYCQLANLLNKAGRSTEAFAVAANGLALDADNGALHHESGNALMEMGDLAAAVESYKRALALSPHSLSASNCGLCLMKQGTPLEARKYLELAVDLDLNCMAALSNLIYFHAFSQVMNPEEQLNIARRWEKAALNEEERAAARGRDFVAKPLDGRKLRLGVLSAEFGRHAVAEFLLPILENMDRDRFHLSLYPTKIYNDERAGEFRRLADAYKPVTGLSDSEAADLIRWDDIDVLLETTAHTSDGRLGIIAHRAAPVQCTSIGFWASTGLSEMDWYITDHTAPPEFDAHYTEDLWRLPRNANCYRGNTSLPEGDWNRSADGTVWLGSFNKYGKIQATTIALWAKVLHAIPEAKLLLEDRTKYDAAIHSRIISNLRHHGIAGGRVEFAPVPASWTAHMLNYNRLDIALDTIPFNSGTTAYDALWMGVPLVAMEGTWVGGIMASACLRTLGHPEWVANSEEEYVSIIAQLARNVELRTELRKTQRSRMAASPLCNASSAAADYENAFVGMYSAWANGTM